jgi:hypothetical protein
MLEVELLSVHAGVEAGAGVLAVEHEHLLAAPPVVDEVLPDEAESVLELDPPVALEDDQQPGVELLREDLVLDEVQDYLTGIDLGVAQLHLDIVEAGQLNVGVGQVVIHHEVPHALDGDPSFLLDVCS